MARVDPAACGLAWVLTVYMASAPVDMRCIELWMNLRMDLTKVKFPEEKGLHKLWIKSLLRNAYYLPAR